MNMLSLCDNGEVLSILRIVKILITIIKIVVPIILIVSLMISYAKAISSKDSDLLAKSIKNSVPKIVAAFLVFLIPTFVSLINSMIDTNDDSYITCLNLATPENIDNAYKNTAHKFIETAYSTLNESDYSYAKNSIKKVNDLSLRVELENELNELDGYMKLKDRILELKDHYDSDEYNSIKAKINDINNAKSKEALNKLLESVKGKVVSLNIKAGVFEKSDYDKEMRYVEVIPEDATTNMPLMIYLHGIWSYATFTENAPNYKITEYVKSGKAYKGEKFILVVPRVVLSQGNSNNIVTWKTNQGKEQTKKLKGLIDFIVDKYKINERKIMITGVSLGGDGTWTMIESYPKLFSAGVPISGCAIDANASNFVSTPIKAFHGTGALEDSYKQCVPAIYNKIKSAGGNITLTVKKGYSHGMMQNVYTDDNGSIFEWMLKQER